MLPGMRRRVMGAAVAGTAVMLVVVLFARSRSRHHEREREGDGDRAHEAREREEEREERARGPLGIRRAGAAELAVQNRVALAESTKIHSRRRLAARAAATGPGTTWVSLGPSEGSAETTYGVSDVVSGRINDVVVDPRDPEIVYIATSGGGVWKTFDLNAPAGARWLPLTDAQPSLAAGALAIDRDRPDTLYLGSGDFFHTAGNTVSKTTDGGLAWSAPVVLDGSYPSQLAAKVSSIRSIGARGDRVIAGTNLGLFVSSDGGASFALVDLPNRSGNVLPEAIWTVVPTESDHWIASGVTGCDEVTPPPRVRTPGADPGPTCRDGNNGEIWTSSDGATWTLADLPTVTGIGRIDLAAGRAVSADAVVAYAYVGAVDHSRSLGFWRSSDGGRSWRDATGTLANPTLPIRSGGELTPGDCPDLNLAYNQTWYDQTIAVDPRNPDHVLVGGALCSARTRNGTASAPTWELVSHWAPSFDSGKTEGGPLDYVHADWQTATIIAVGDEVRALAGTDGGLFTSRNVFDPAIQPEQVRWTPHNRGLTTHLLFSLASGDPTAGNRFVLFAGLQDNGTRLRSDPARPSVFDEVLGGDGIGATVHAATSGTTYWGSSQFTRLYCQPARGSCADGARWQFTPALAGDPSEAVAAPRGDEDPFAIHYADVVTDATGPSVLTHSIGQVFVAIDGPGSGLAWQAISQDVSGDGIYLTNVAASSTIPGLYGAAAASGFRGSGPSPVPFYVTAQGATPSTWVAAQPVRPTGDARMSTASSIAFPPVLPPGTAPGQVYLGAFVGVLDDPAQTPPPDDQGRLYRTTDFGQTWTSAVGADPAHRLPNVSVYVVKYDPVVPTTLYAGTELGVYLSTDDGATWDRMGEGLPIVPVRDLYVARNQDFIRVATFGRGLWEIYPSASAERGASGNGDYDRNQRIDWIDIAASAARLGVTPATTLPPLYSWIMDVSSEGDQPPVQAIDEADLAAVLATFGGRP